MRTSWDCFPSLPLTRFQLLFEWNKKTNPELSIYFSPFLCGKWNRRQIQGIFFLWLIRESHIWGIFESSGSFRAQPQKPNRYRSFNISSLKAQRNPQRFDSCIARLPLLSMETRQTHSHGNRTRWKFLQRDDGESPMEQISLPSSFFSAVVEREKFELLWGWRKRGNCYERGRMMFFMSALFILLLPFARHRASRFLWNGEPTKETWTIIRDAMNYWRTSNDKR